MNPSKKSSEVYEFNYNVSLGNSFNASMEAFNDNYDPFSTNEFIANYRTKYKSYFDKKNSWQKIENDWLFSAGNLAIALDSAVNNTSLAIAIEFIKTGKVLLFPGDAQIGNWLSWYNYRWVVTDEKGRKNNVTIDDLLNRTVFYKVSHHASHNGTLEDKGLEKMNSNELVVMIPVDKEMAKSRNWKMPYEPLLNALNEKSRDRVIQQDEKMPQNIKNTSSEPLYHQINILNK
jgi:hypothetical protein